jgi:hypothetical protein
MAFLAAAFIATAIIGCNENGGAGGGPNPSGSAQEAQQRKVKDGS